MSKTIYAVAGLCALAVAAPALASETIDVPFTTADGGVTSGLYSGLVQIDVSGIGQSNGTLYNDAFYMIDTAVHDADYYQLSYALIQLLPLGRKDAYYSIVGGLPAYNPNHTYSFVLNTGASVPTTLHFGVSDGIFTDNSGSFLVTITQLPVPEAASWALMILGFGAVGAGLRRGRALQARVAFH